MTPKDVFLLLTILLVILTVICFAYIQYVRYNAKARNWNRLNSMAALTIILTLNSIIPQMLLVGRTAAQCRFLHHWSGSFYNLTNGLSRLFFQLRSNQIAPNIRKENRLGRWMAGAIIVIIGISVINNNLTMETFVEPPLNVCVGRPDPLFALLIVLILPALMDIATNIRFFRHIFLTTQQISGSVSSSHAKAPIRLLRITCILSISSATISFLTMMFVFNIIPIQDPTWITVLLAAEQAYNACAMAWPAIYIHVWKRLTKPSNDINRRSTWASSDPKSANSNVATSVAIEFAPGRS